MPWPELRERRDAGRLPIFVGGWREGFHDPYNWMQAFLFSQSGFAHVINMTDDYRAKYDQWILDAAMETDQQRRCAIYEQVQFASQEDAIAIWMYQQINMVPLQLWIKDFYFNPAYGQEAFSWIYALAKEAE